MQPTKDPIQWWLVSDDDVRKIAEFLRGISDDPDHYPQVRDEARDALHTLETGLHATAAIPADFAPVAD